MDKYTIGVDVSRRACTWAVLTSGTREVVAQGEVARTPQALATWAHQMRAQWPQAQVLAEATGGLERRVLEAAQKAGLPAVAVNPERVRHLRRASGQAKTDRLDAALIALYGAIFPQAAPPVHPLREQMRQLLIRREQVVHMIQQERMHAFWAREQGATAMLEDIQQTLAFLEARKAALEAEIQALEDALRQTADPLWQALQRIQGSLPGMGPWTARALWVWLPELGRLNRKQVARLTGTAPLAHESGQQRKRRWVRDGRQRLRRYLFMSAMVSVRFNPVLRAFYERLLARGKAKKVALVAVMRRMVIWVNAMVRDGTVWDPERAWPRTPDEKLPAGMSLR